MIGAIDYQADVDIYLDPGEIIRLKERTLEGVLIKRERPKRQGTITISINDERQNEKGFGIGFDDSRYWGVTGDDFHLDVFMGSEYYQRLQGNGVVGLRQSMLDGSKINIFDRSRLERLQAWGVDHLEFYRDNKDELIEELG